MFPTRHPNLADKTFLALGGKCCALKKDSQPKSLVGYLEVEEPTEVICDMESYTAAKRVLP